jgi:hypothetical protein
VLGSRSHRGNSFAATRIKLHGDYQSGPFMFSVPMSYDLPSSCRMKLIM